MSSHRAPTAAAPRAATQTLFGEFLRARRVQCTPEQEGLPAVGRPRRVAGLRREEVAQLAKVSTDYYTRLEQGRVPPPSSDVLDAIADQVTTHSQRGRINRHPTIGVVNMEWSELTNSAQPDVMIIVLTPAEDTSRRLLLDAAASLTHPARRPQPTPVATER